MASGCRKLFKIIRAALHEIFDESSYERFLSRRGVPRSIKSYHAFLLERESAASKNPRCC